MLSKVQMYFDLIPNKLKTSSHSYVMIMQIVWIVDKILFKLRMFLGFNKDLMEGIFLEMSFLVIWFEPL
jgi:hypothetical protein